MQSYPVGKELNFSVQCHFCLEYKLTFLFYQQPFLEGIPLSENMETPWVGARVAVRCPDLPVKQYGLINEM